LLVSYLLQIVPSDQAANVRGEVDVSAEQWHAIDMYAKCSWERLARRLLACRSTFCQKVSCGYLPQGDRAGHTYSQLKDLRHSIAPKALGGSCSVVGFEISATQPWNLE
jgi:hypothetical protein